MKKLTLILLGLFMAVACTKENESLFEPEYLKEEKKDIDTVYAGLDQLATDNGYDSIPQLLKSEIWSTSREEKYLIRNSADTFYVGILPAGGEWQFQFEPWPFSTSRIYRNDVNGSYAKDDFTPYPNRFEIDGNSDFLLFNIVRYVDSTLSFDLKRESILDSITRVEYFRLQNQSSKK